MYRCYFNVNTVKPIISPKEMTLGSAKVGMINIYSIYCLYTVSGGNEVTYGSCMWFIVSTFLYLEFDHNFSKLKAAAKSS